MAEFHDGPHATPKPSETGPVYLGIKNITDEGHLDLSTTRHIAEEDFPKWIRRVQPQPGDIVFSYEATLHRYAVIPEGFRGCLGRRLALIRPDISKVDTRYLHYYFLSPLWKRTVLNRINIGSTVDRIPLVDFQDFPVVLPSLDTQRRITSVLSAYDDLIANNTRRITVLEDMARLIYREWFVEFRYPGHEGVPTVESELGPIPEGWEVGQLDQLVENVRDATQPGTHLHDLPYIPIDAIERRSAAIISVRPGEEARSSLALFREDDILFGAMRPYFHKVAVAPRDGVTRTTCLVLRPMAGSYSYEFMLLFSDETISYASSHTSGSTIPYVNWKGSLESMPILIPPIGVRQLFDEIVRPMLRWIASVGDRQRALHGTRDLLLPRLVSGDVDVSNLDIDLGVGA